MADDKKFSAKEFEEYYSSREEGEQTIIDKMFEQVNIAKKLENVYGNVQKQLKANRTELKSINAQLVEVGQAVLEKQKVINGLTEQISSAQVVMQESIKKEIELKQNLIKMEEDITYIQRNKEELQKKINESIEKETKEILKIEEIKKRILKNDGALKANLDAMTTNKTKLVGIEDKIRATEEEARKIEQQGMGYTGEYETALNKILLLKKKKADLEEKNTQYQRDQATLLSRADILSYNLEQAEHNRNSTLADRINLNVDLVKANEAELKLTEERKKVLSDISNIESTLREKAKEIEGLNKEKNKQEDEKVGLLLKQENLFSKQSQLMQKLNKLNAILVFTQLLKMAFDRFVQLDAAAEKFRRETGFSVTQMEQLRKNAEAINVQFADMGVSIEKVYDSAKALADVFGRTTLITQEALKNVALLSANLNVVETDSASVLATFQGLGNATEEAAMNVIKVGAGISEKAGIPFSLVMKDIASASEQTTTMLGANPSKLMKAAIAARSLGVDMNKLVSSQRKLLDFSSSINDELEVSALLGKSVSFQKARQLAYEGDIEGAAKATLETVKAAGNFDKMNVYQREALAKASGMELKDLTKMMAIEKQRSEIMASGDTERINKLLAQEEELKKLKNINDLNDKDLVNQNEKALLQEKMQGVMTRLKNTMDSLVVAFADILEPIITPLITLLVPGMKILAGLVKIIIYPFKALSNIFVDLGKQTEEISSNWQWIKSASDAISNLTQKIKDFYKENEKVIDRVLGIAAGGGLFAMMFAGSKGLGGVSKMITSPLASFKGGLAKIPGIGGMFGGGKSPIDGVEKVGKSAKSGGLGEGLGKMISGFMEYVANGIGYFGNSKVLKGAVGIALVGASIIPFAYAMTLFSNVDWKSVGIGALALAGFTAAAFGLGLLLSSGVGAAIFGAGVIGIAALGVALIPFSVAALAAGAGVKMLGEGISSSVDPIMKLSEIDLTTTALGITAVAAALAAFGGGSAASGLGSFVGSLLGGDPIKKMQALAEVGDKLKITADAISQISVATSQFGAVDSFSGAISKLAESLTTLNNSIRGFNFEGLKTIFQTSIGENTATTTAQPPATFATSGVEAKLDELINLLKDGAIGVNIDGIKASKVLARAST